MAKATTTHSCGSTADQGVQPGSADGPMVLQLTNRQA